MTNLPIPAEALVHHTALLGKTGAGKTSTGKLLVERLAARGERVCILDPIKSDWWGLTSSADGRSAGLPFQILGGPHGHVPLPSSSGRVIGELVASGALPMSILDMADFEPGAHARFFIEFASTLIKRMEGVVNLVLEEAHLFAPKERSGIGDENLAIHWAKTLATAGRSKGIRLILATQRTQALHNAMLGSCETLIAHRLTAPADQEPVVKWLKSNLDKELAARIANPHHHEAAMTRPRILDLYCGAGMVADGLIAAGAEVIGVDIEDQPRYPGPFVRADALEQEGLLRWADGVWASPPCLKDTVMKYAPGAKGDAHPDLITPTRALLRRCGKPYVIENVATAPLLDPVVLNGFMFDLGVEVDGVRYHLQRRRKFETNWPLVAPSFQRRRPVIGVYGGHARCRAASAGGRSTVDFAGVADKTALMRAAMGVERRLTGAEVSQGIPPAYSEYVGRALLAHLELRRTA